MKLFRRCPVLLLLFVTGALFSGISARGERSVYRNIPASSGYEPACAPMMKGIHEGIYPWSTKDTGPAESENKKGLIRAADAIIPSDTGVSGTVSGSNIPESDSLSGNEAKEPDSLSGNAVKEPDSLSENALGEPDSLSGNAAEKTEAFETAPLSGEQAENMADGEEPIYRHVEEDYFDDALFIGDSRTVGLFEYGQIEDRAQFYAQTSLMIYEVMENPKAIVKTEDGKEFITVEEALSEKQFGKIYMMLGLNEMGFGTPESFGKAYGAVVSRIRELQPDAVIYIQSIMHVAGEKNQTDPVYNNTNIDLRNQPLMQLADNEHIFYLDINEALCDETGCLVSDWTFDQVHLKAAYYQVWKDYLLDHGIVRSGGRP